MRKLFDRAKGEIRNIVIQRKSDNKKIRPGAEANWKKLWKTADPLAIGKKAAGSK